MGTRDGYDLACFELALHFLNADATWEMKDALAQHIQDAVEDWLYDKDGTPTGPEERSNG